LCEDVFETLERFRMSMCIHDLLPEHPQRITAKTVYLRFHGATGKYHGSYPRARLKKWAGWIQQHASAGHDVYVYFNNDIEGHAVKDALLLRELVA
jgi:uncharacterized protein YecE (DUF72 family)